MIFWTGDVIKGTNAVTSILQKLKRFTKGIELRPRWRGSPVGFRSGFGKAMWKADP